MQVLCKNKDLLLEFQLFQKIQIIIIKGYSVMSISEPTKRRLVALLKLLDDVKLQRITSVEISRISG